MDKTSHRPAPAARPVWRGVAILPLVLMTACVMPVAEPIDRNSPLTHGNVQMNLQVGTTSKAQVLETFGAPNITTRDGSGQEVWTYQRAGQARQSSSRSGYWTVILAGQGGRTSGLETSSQMMTLIIKFDADDLVSDFSSRASNF